MYAEKPKKDIYQFIGRFTAVRTAARALLIVDSCVMCGVCRVMVGRM